MRTIYLFFSFFILSIFSVFGSIVDVEKTHIRITSPDSLIHFHFYQRMDSDEPISSLLFHIVQSKVTIKESRMGLELIIRSGKWHSQKIFNEKTDGITI